MPVVAPFEFDDLVAAGIAPGQADGTHGGFGAGVDHAHHVHGGHQFADLVCHGHFGGGWGAEAEAVLHRCLHGSNHLGMVVAEDHRAPRAHVVDVAIVIFIVQVGATGRVEKHRCAAHALEGTHGRVNTAGNMFLGLAEKLFGVLAAHGVSSCCSCRRCRASQAARAAGARWSAHGKLRLMVSLEHEGAMTRASQWPATGKWRHYEG